MKYFFLFTLLITSLTISAQQLPTGKLIAKNPFPKAGVENIYIYTPPKGLIISEKAKVAVMFTSKPFFKLKKLDLQKKGLVYEFSVTIPDSTSAYVASIIDENNKAIDNNNEQGYLITLYDKKNEKFPLSDITTIGIRNIAASYLKLKAPPALETLKLYEKIFKEDSTVKEKYYYTYLRLLYNSDKEEGKTKLTEYAKTLLSTNDESKWITAYYIYTNLKLVDEKKQTEIKILNNFPLGELARENAQTAFRMSKEPDSMITKMNQYYEKFHDTTTSLKDNLFYPALINAYANKKDWTNFYKYVDSISDINQLNSSFNSIAWHLSGESLTKQGEDLETAKDISAKSLAFTQNIINNPAKYSSKFFFLDKDFVDGMQSNYYNMFADTYALILYKLGNFDSAFYYQQIAVKDVSSADAEELERYCVYGEKVRGAAFIRNFLEEQLLNGKGTSAMKAQLKSIYQKENLPETNYDKMIAKVEAKAKEKMLKGIKEKEKNFKAIGFTLKNLDGKSVSLASLKGKVVILDFWATWCGPCKASFPGMQLTVNKYKDDKDVVFLFVDTWESKDPTPMKNDAAKFIKDNKYTFNVLLDEKDKVITDYKVEGVPTKFIINKKGNVKYQSVGFGGNADELVEELSIMIENAKK